MNDPQKLTIEEVVAKLKDAATNSNFMHAYSIRDQLIESMVLNMTEAHGDEKAYMMTAPFGAQIHELFTSLWHFDRLGLLSHAIFFAAMCSDHGNSYIALMDSNFMARVQAALTSTTG